MKTPCCTDDSLIYLLAFAFLVSVFFYLHKPHRPSEEFHSGIGKAIGLPISNAVNRVKRKLDELGGIREEMRIKAHGTVEGFRTRKDGGGGGGGEKTKAGEKDAKIVAKKDIKETESNSETNSEDTRVKGREGGSSGERQRTIEEWSEHKRRPTFDVQVEPYNTDYMQVYDKLTYSNAKFDYEIGIILHHLKKARIFAGVSILDVGCGTGNHVAHLRNSRYEVIGLDRSEDAVNFCQRRHSDHKENYKVGDAMLPTQFREKMFTHILCLNNTIYYMEDASLFFKNCATWLKNDGLLFLHMIDDFEQRYFDTNGWIKLKGGTRYKSSYDVHKGKTYVDEKIKDRTGNILLNKHVMYNVGETEKLLRMADKKGLIVIRKYSLKKVGFKHHYLYVLKK